MIIAIVPARKGSKRLPGKNKKLLHGKPLICWTIEPALESKIELIIVSSDDRDIFQICAAYDGKIEKHERPAELATDHASMNEVVYDIIKDMENDDIIVLLQPTNALRTADDINYFLDIFTDFPLVSVDKHWEPNGSLYISRVRDFRWYRGFYTPKTRYIPMLDEKSVDIDFIDDFITTSRLIQKNGI